MIRYLAKLKRLRKDKIPSKLKDLKNSDMTLG